MNRITSGLARPSIDLDQPPDDRHMAHVLRNLHRIVPAPLGELPMQMQPLQRETPTSARITFTPRKPRPFWRLMLDYITMPYP